MFQISEVLLASRREDLRYRLSRLLYDSTVEVDELEAHGPGEQAAQGALTAAHVPDDGQGPVHASVTIPRLRDACGVGVVAGADVCHVVPTELLEEGFREHDGGHGLPDHRRRRHRAGVGPLLEGPRGLARGEVDRA